MNARDELARIIACADAHQLVIIEDIARRIAAGESDESIAARYGLKRTASGECEKVNVSDNASNKTDCVLRSQI